MSILESRGNIMIEADSGELASGLEGKGRMAEPERIFSVLDTFFEKKKDLDGKKIMITAGPTFENIDPVRFIGNRSTGKMGYAVAKAAAERGAQVKLISGPVSLSLSHPLVDVISVETAQEMYNAAHNFFKDSDIAIFAAAVADYKPSKIADKKIKKSDETEHISLVPTIDIAKSLNKNKKPGMLSIGFALETDNEIENAQEKIQKKNFDFIVLNSLRDKGAGFGYDTNKISIIDKNNKKEQFELKSKDDVAQDILNKISELLN